MTKRMRNRLTEILTLFALAAATAVVMPRAHAEMIGTEQAAPTERERLKAALDRPEVVQALKKMGVDAHAASGRVDAMSNSEVAQLAGRIDALPAGGQISNETLVIILLVVLILLVAL
jgi:Ribonuclease G/E